jgi:hypothetical protein
MAALLFIAGLASIVAGLAMIFAPAAFIFGGLGLCVLAVLQNDPDRDRD